eukprot:SAG31_NODE_3300_length_4443_cov_3.762431_4_plen_67_part_00
MQHGRADCAAAVVVMSVANSVAPPGATQNDSGSSAHAYLVICGGIGALQPHNFAVCCCRVHIKLRA